MPPRAKTPEEIELEQNAILDAAMELMTELGHRDLSMRMIAKKCQTSATKLYYYFSNKEELLLCIIGREYEELLARMNRDASKGSNPEEQFLYAVISICNYGRTHARCYDLLFANPDIRYSQSVCSSKVIATVQKHAHNFYDGWSRWAYAFGSFAEKGITEYECALKFSQVHGFISLYGNRSLIEDKIKYEKSLELLLVQIVQ